MSGDPPPGAAAGRPAFADLHVHLGRAAGRPVKISASRDLTLRGILAWARARKGLDVVGIVDAATTWGLRDLEEAVAAGALEALDAGGLRAPDGLLLLPGAEVELAVAGSRVHFVVFVPGLAEARALHGLLARHSRNPGLSSQLARGLDLPALLEAAGRLGGVVWPAHAFTPHRGLYGCAVSSVRAELGPEVLAAFAAVELGLSADTDMADRLGELGGHTFLSNSDAHGLETLGRECNLLRLGGEPTWEEVVRCLARDGGRAVAANFGLVPALGKYHRTACPRCGTLDGLPPPVLACPRCGERRVVLGVLDRLTQIADRPEPVHPPHRPPYRPQVPLRLLPGVGPRTAERLLAAVGPELHVLHLADPDDIARAAGPRVAAAVVAARRGELRLRTGGGGRYGAVLGPAGQG
jgi:uncharacterized protein (TIGR00375 family)